MDEMKDGDRHRAVAAAYAAHADDVYRLAYAILRDPDEAVDATQDVFVRASRAGIATTRSGLCGPGFTPSPAAWRWIGCDGDA